MQNIIATNLQQLDATGVTMARRNITFTNIAPTVGEFRSGTLTDTTLDTQTLPISPALNFWIRNTSATATITVTWTQNGGSSASVITLGPGDMTAFWATNAVAGTYGITQLKLQANLNPASYEWFVGG